MFPDTIIIIVKKMKGSVLTCGCALACLPGHTREAITESNFGK